MNGDESYERFSPRLIQFVVAVLIGVAIMGFMAFKTAKRGPFGRRQFIDVTPDQQVSLGIQAYRDVLSKSDILSSGPIVSEVEDVTKRLVHATKNAEFLRLTKVQLQNYPWEVKVVRSKEVNAFCLPGGKMVVYTAILPVCVTDAGLATVMGHEISHALAQHGAERMTQTKLANIGLTAAGVSMGGMNPRDRGRLMQVLNAGAQFGILKYSRTHESEADHIGLLLMATAGYDPNEAVKFWERMRAKTGSGGKTPEFMSTHPSHETRIRDLMKWIPQAMPLYEASDERSRTKALTLP